MRTQDISSGETSATTSDDELSPKRSRLSSPQHIKSVEVRNPVWQSVILENSLESSFHSTVLDSHNVVSVNRGSESYSYLNEDCCHAPDYDKDVLPSGRKRPLSDRLAPRSYDKALSRTHYGVTFDSSPGDVAAAITNLLEEHRDDLIRNIVQLIGVKRALEFCYLTEDIEKRGGLCTVDGARRRTPGGVFFFLIRHSDSVTKEEKKVIFKETSKTKLLKKRLRQAERRRERQSAALHTHKQSSQCEEDVDIENLPSPRVHIE